jgi:hypothetical protein
LGPLAEEALKDLISYYLRVLNEDTVQLGLQPPLRFEGLESRASTEIMSIAATEDLGKGFDILDEQGLARLRDEAGRNQFAGAAAILDFLDWTERLDRGPEGEAWQAGRPKLLAIYAEKPSCGSVRALMVTRIIPAQNRTWYTLLTEVKEKPEWPFPLSESAGRFTAREYGRFF